MNSEQFIKELQDILQRSEQVSLATQLNEVEEWDSLSMMALSAYLHKKLDVNISSSEIIKFKTVQDIWDFIKAHE